MESIKLLGHTCIGASHITSGKPCQDNSESFSWEKGKLIIVSDGHGSDKYFRSDRGSEIAVKVTKNAIVSFVENFTATESLPTFKARGINGITDESSEDYTPYDYDYEPVFRHLFNYIVSEWYRLITEDWTNNPPTDEEYEKADSSKTGKIKKYFNCQNPELAKAYGCTLIAAVRTSDYWFAFQLGDGKCIAFKEDGTWFEPIPWDSRCFLNQTTSLSGQGSESFRYCIGTNKIPALFIGSDGMDDSYPPISCLANWYKLILKKINEHNVEKVQEMIEDFLPQLSKQGSKDDMSLRFWVDNTDISTLCKNIIQKDIIAKEEQCANLEREISKIDTDIFVIKNSIETMSSLKECNVSFIDKTRNYLTSLMDSINYLKSQLTQKETDYAEKNDIIRKKEQEVLTQNDAITMEESKLFHCEQIRQKKQKELELLKKDLEESMKQINYSACNENTDCSQSFQNQELNNCNSEPIESKENNTDIPVI